MADAASLGALGASVVRPPFLAYLDIAGDQVRATTWETAVTPTGTADPDLDGHVFDTVSPQFVDVGGVTRATGGADQVTLTLSGIVGPDGDLLNLLGNPVTWKGRLVRLWFMLLAEDRATRIGVVFPFYTGRMMGMSIKGSPADQKVELVCESYLASLTSASNRSYLDQGSFDSNDTSAGLTVAVANGATSPNASSNMTAGSASFGGGVLFNNYREF